LSKIAKSVIQTIEVFCTNNHPLGITELSNIMLDSKSSIHQKIKILEELEIIEQDKNSKKYCLTTKLLELVNKSLKGYYERTHIHNYLKSIAEETGQCTYFGLKNRKNRVVYIDRYASENAMTVYTNIGDSPLPYCTAHGKALLAFLTLDEIEDTIKEGLRKFTENTITDKKQLMVELKKIREKGYAYDDEERMVGVRCVAAPVFNSYREVIGAIGISGISQSMTYEKMESSAKFIKEIADRMSLSLGNDIIF
jgi:DNA-binding IclR family transcriptional regulator